MKNKKFPKWLQRLPVLLLALILAVMPMTVAVPVSANSDVLTGFSVPSFVGYSYIGSVVSDGPTLHFYIPSNYFLSYYAYCIAFVDDPSAVTICRSMLLSFYDDYVFLTSGDIYQAQVNFDILSQYSDDNAQFFCYDFVSASTLQARYTPSDDSILVNFNGVVRETPLTYDLMPASRFSGGDGVLSVFSGVGDWLFGAVQNISTMFWTAETGMTVLGYLAVASLALAVILLIFYLIAGWLKFH